MSEATERASAYATIALGASQALIPRIAGVAFGLGDVEDGRTLWLARLLGVANMGLGAAGLNPESRRLMRPVTFGVLAADAVVTLAAGARRDIPARAAVSVVAFVAGLAAGFGVGATTSDA